MNISYEYQIANLDVGDVGGRQDVVTAIHYRVVAKRDDIDIHPVHSGVVPLESPGETFTEFNALTKVQVEQWLKAKIDVAGVEESLKAQLEQMSAQPEETHTTSKLPAWAASA